MLYFEKRKFLQVAVLLSHNVVQRKTSISLPMQAVLPRKQDVLESMQCLQNPKTRQKNAAIIFGKAIFTAVSVMNPQNEIRQAATTDSVSRLVKVCELICSIHPPRLFLFCNFSILQDRYLKSQAMLLQVWRIVYFYFLQSGKQRKK